MKRISKAAVQRARGYVAMNASSLALALFDFRLGPMGPEQVLSALSHYQNQDGGFGNGLEPDFLLPDSSPMATSIAFQIFHELDVGVENGMVRRATDYLLRSYDDAIGKWRTVPPTVNRHPHAPWWHFNEEGNGTALDAHWGNPTAEIIGYLHKYAPLARGPLVEGLYNIALRKLLEFEGEMEFHELLCFQRFSEQLHTAVRPMAQRKLAELVEQVVSLDRGSWEAYSPQPLDFVKLPESFLTERYQAAINANLDFWIDSLHADGVWFPNWSWGQYEAAWQSARKTIAGHLTSQRLATLTRFGRLE